MSPVCGRFAPTPSGLLHLGNLFCSLLAWLSARSQGGEVLLRIEDLDVARTDPAYTARAKEDLLTLGLPWDRESTPQSQRSAYYADCLEKLEALGLVYPCFCSRGELHAASAPHASDGEVIYSGKCRRLTPEETATLRKLKNPALRLRVPRETLSFTDRHYGPCSQDLAVDCGDFILRRSDGVYAYQLAVVADDAQGGVTEVVRGRDLLSSTPRQLYLCRLLGAPEPAYAHTPLVLAPGGRRLSKRDRDDSLTGLLDRGFTPEQVVGELACLAGLLEKPEPVTPQELIPLFDWAKVPLEDVELPGRLYS